MQEPPVAPVNPLLEMFCCSPMCFLIGSRPVAVAFTLAAITNGAPTAEISAPPPCDGPAHPDLRTPRGFLPSSSPRARCYCGSPTFAPSSANTFACRPSVPPAGLVHKRIEHAGYNAPRVLISYLSLDTAIR